MTKKKIEERERITRANELDFGRKLDQAPSPYLLRLVYFSAEGPLFGWSLQTCIRKSAFNKGS